MSKAEYTIRIEKSSTADGALCWGVFNPAGEEIAGGVSMRTKADLEKHLRKYVDRIGGRCAGLVHGFNGTLPDGRKVWVHREEQHADT